VLFIASAWFVACVKTETRKAQDGSPEYKLERDARLDVEQAARNLRHQADFFQEHHSDDPLFQWNLYYYNGPLGQIINTLDKCEISIVNLRWLCDQVDTGKQQPKRDINYRQISDELNRIAAQLPQD